MSTPDFRNEEPVWTKYLVYVDSRSDKFYEARVDMGDDGTFYLTKRWGRNPDTGDGQIKVESYGRAIAATSNAEEIIRTKIAKGYRYTVRPYAASSNVSRDYTDED